MRKIDYLVCSAFWGGKELSIDNTQVKLNDQWVEVYLHGSCIARRRGSRLEVSAAGHVTQTTKARINAIVMSKGYSVNQKNHMWFITTYNNPRVAVRMNTAPGEWTIVDPGSDLERIAYSSEE